MWHNATNLISTREFALNLTLFVIGCKFQIEEIKMKHVKGLVVDVVISVSRYDVDVEDGSQVQDMDYDKLQETEAVYPGHEIAGSRFFTDIKEAEAFIDDAVIQLQNLDVSI